MFCPKCGKEIDKTDAFCRCCGAKIEPILNQNSVPEIKKEGFTRNIKCSNCGSNLVVMDNTKEFAVCEYCGANTVLDDFRVRQHFVDEASIRQTEAESVIRMRELDIIEKRGERRRRANKIKAIIGGMIFLVCIIIIIILCNGGFGNEMKNVAAGLVAMFLFYGGIIAFFSIKGAGSDENLTQTKSDSDAGNPDMSIGGWSINFAPAQSMFPILILLNLNYKVAQSQIKTAGFSNIACVNLCDITHANMQMYRVDDVDSITVNGEPFEGGKFYHPSSKVIIYFHGKKK